LLRHLFAAALFTAIGCGSDAVEPPADTASSGDVDAGANPATNYSVCCETEDGAEYTTNVACLEANGTEVALTSCPAVCCDESGSYSWIPPSECAGEGMPSHPGHCLEICCQLESETTTLLQGNCAAQGGVEVEAALCDPQEELCCRYVDGTFGVASAEDCQLGEGQETNAESCEEVCCQLSDGTAEAMLSGACTMANGAAVDAAQCDEPAEDVCCKDPNGQGPEVVPANECEADAVVDDALCEPPPAEVCCQQGDGTYLTVSETDCPPESVVDEALCEPPPAEVCCQQGDGTYLTVSETDCPPESVVDEALCEAPPAEVCCRTESAIGWVAEEDCPPDNVASDALCDRLFCCKIMTGPNVGDALTLSWPDCEEAGGAVVYDGYCEQTICCQTDAGPTLMPFSDCTFAQLTQTSDCEPEPEPSCCKIMDGEGAGNAIMATPSECADQNGAFVPESYCTQEVCCQTDSGPQFTSYVDCTFLALTVTTDCEPPQETGCCKDMEAPGLGDAWLATPEDCYASGGAPVFQEYCDQEVCCDMGAGPSWMPYSDCTFFDLVATYDDSDAPCSPPDELQCCKISFGVNTGDVVMATSADCAELSGIVTVQEYCDQTV